MAVIIIAILITALVVPLFAGLDLGARDRTYTNAGLSADLAEEEDVTLDIRLNEAHTDVIMTVNGKAESYPVDMTEKTVFYFIGASMIVYFYVYDDPSDVSSIKTYMGVRLIVEGAQMNSSISMYDGSWLTIKLSKAGFYTMTATTHTMKSGVLQNETTETSASSWMLYPAQSGDYVMYGPQYGTVNPEGMAGAWAEDGSTLIWAGYNWTGTGDTSNMLVMKGNPYDPSSVKGNLIIGTTQTAISMRDSDSIEVLDEEDGVKKFGAITVEDAGVDFTESVFGAPKTIFIPGDPNKKAIMSMIDMIPLLLMVGLVVGVVGAYRMRGEAQR